MTQLRRNPAQAANALKPEAIVLDSDSDQDDANGADTGETTPDSPKAEDDKDFVPRDEEADRQEADEAQAKPEKEPQAVSLAQAPIARTRTAR